MVKEFSKQEIGAQSPGLCFAAACPVALTSLARPPSTSCGQHLRVKSPPAQGPCITVEGDPLGQLPGLSPQPLAKFTEDAFQHSPGLIPSR